MGDLREVQRVESDGCLCMVQWVGYSSSSQIVKLILFDGSIHTFPVEHFCESVGVMQTHLTTGQRLEVEQKATEHFEAHWGEIKNGTRKVVYY